MIEEPRQSTVYQTNQERAGRGDSVTIYKSAPAISHHHFSPGYICSGRMAFDLLDLAQDRLRALQMTPAELLDDPLSLLADAASRKMNQEKLQLR